MMPFRNDSNYWSSLLGGLTLLFLTFPQQLLAQHLTCPPFEIRNPETSSHSMYGAAQGGGLIVSVGLDQILTSADGGGTFTAIDPGDYRFRDVLWTGNRFVACTDSGEIFSSEDGLVWTLRLKGVTSRYFSTLATSGSIIVAAGRSYSATSPDGIVWTENDPVPGQFNELSWDGTFFKSVGYYMTHLISADGINWTVTPLGIQDEFSSIGFDGVNYVAAGDRTNLIYHSTTSTGWTAYPVPDAYLTQKKIRYANGYFFLLTFRDNLRSADGIHWEVLQFDSRTGFLQDVIWTGSRYLAFGLGNLIFESLDGLSWNLKNAFASVSGSKISWDGDNFVLLSYSNQLWKSANGIHWQASDLPGPEQPYWSDMAHSPAGHMIVGNSNEFLFSQNGNDWELRDNGLDVRFDTIDWLNNAWIAVGTNGMIYRSLNGHSWDGYNASPYTRPYETAYHNGTYVVVGYASGSDGFIATSHNLVDWNHQVIENIGRFYDVTWIGDRFLAGAEDGWIFQSSDGDTWTPFANDLENNVKKIIYNGRDILILDNLGYLLRSEDPDGLWVKEDHRLIQFAEDMVMQEETLVVMNGGSAIFTRECGLCYQADEVAEQVADWTRAQDVAFLVQIVNSPCAP